MVGSVVAALGLGGELVIVVVVGVGGSIGVEMGEVTAVVGGGMAMAVLVVDVVKVVSVVDITVAMTVVDVGAAMEVEVGDDIDVMAVVAWPSKDVELLRSSLEIALPTNCPIGPFPIREPSSISFNLSKSGLPVESALI